ncbi:putative inactive receptor-like protein kinase [Glycine soja]|uniref:Putative inactive receptor-like protein kinase n=1 Tax=Glycine soja TaxID=3848 RepID=A0A445J030_GLYSO|nr:putative inactive receptor-like protein kinase [Glycine soja]
MHFFIWACKCFVPFFDAPPRNFLQYLHWALSCPSIILILSKWFHTILLSLPPPVFVDDATWSSTFMLGGCCIGSLLGPSAVPVELSTGVVREGEELNWTMRMRIAMGIAYCLEYMHELKPPIAHRNLQSSFIYLTEDYAAKISDLSLWNDMWRIPLAGNNELLADWAAEYVRWGKSLRHVVDPRQKSLQEEEIEEWSEVIRNCVQPDPERRQASPLCEGDGSKSNGDASSGYYYKSMDHRDEDQMHKRDREQHIDTYVVTN